MDSIETKIPGPNSHDRRPACWIKHKMQSDRGKNISELIDKYVERNKSFDFIYRVIPTMTVNQYTKALGRHSRRRQTVHLGNKSVQYCRKESEMGKLPVYLPSDLKGWEKKEFLFEESVTLFPLFTYEE